MMWCTGSQMHATPAPAASNDMTKQGRKYGNLKVDMHNSKAYLVLRSILQLLNESSMRDILPPKYGLFREKIWILLCRLVQNSR